MRKRRAAGLETAADPVKVRARAVVKMALRRGTMERPACCSRCGTQGPVEGHHADYAKAREVAWLCRACHRDVHRPAVWGTITDGVLVSTPVVMA